ncbi:hypothetical protein ID866_11116 [Astraeus odoratus]|nr:hypothetical protein ID866_11116 [Astraeus odoratus]
MLEATSSPKCLRLASPVASNPLPESYDSDTSSSSASSDGLRPIIIPRSKRVVEKGTPSPDVAEISTPTPTTIIVDNNKADPLLSGTSYSRDDTPLVPSRILQDVNRRELEEPAGKHARHASDSGIGFVAKVVEGEQAAVTGPRSIRTKFGQPVKSSLKSARRPNLSVITSSTSAKSEPATPTLTKAVHFDSKLEHVRLFLAGQKPLAVSRDGVTTSDTSGTDDFPLFGYGDEPEVQKKVKMIVPNMHSSPRSNVDVVLDDIALLEEQRTLHGKVRVRNITYEKWLAVRFTTDWWQTTSEVTAHYEQSVEGGAYDIFTFSIRLHDIWSWIEDKSMFIALRYVVAGREYWDNNGGQNYHIKFVVTPIPPSGRPSAARRGPDRTAKDLKSRLEAVARTKAVPSVASSYRIQRSFSADPTSSPLPSHKSLSHRYDFASASKTPWSRSALPRVRHIRTHTRPTHHSAQHTQNPSATDGRMVDEDDSTQEPIAASPKLQHPPTPSSLPQEMSPSKDTPLLSVGNDEAGGTITGVAAETPFYSRRSEGRGRNHVRGYVDHVMPTSPAMKRTPPGSPLRLGFTHGPAHAYHQVLPRTHSYPFTDVESVNPHFTGWEYRK